MAGEISDLRCQAGGSDGGEGGPTERFLNGSTLDLWEFMPSLRMAKLKLAFFRRAGLKWHVGFATAVVENIQSSRKDWIRQSRKGDTGEVAYVGGCCEDQCFGVKLIRSMLVNRSAWYLEASWYVYNLCLPFDYCVFDCLAAVLVFQVLIFEAILPLLRVAVCYLLPEFPERHDRCKSRVLLDVFWEARGPMQSFVLPLGIIFGYKVLVTFDAL